MEKLLLYYLAAIAFYPLVQVAIVASANINGPIGFPEGFWLFIGIPFILTLIPTLIAAHYWAGSAWHAFGALGMYILLALVIGNIHNRLIDWVDHRTPHYTMNTWRDGDEEGKWELRSVDHEQHGRQRYWRSDGSLHHVETWVHGRMEGEYMLYYSNGQIAEQGTMRGSDKNHFDPKHVRTGEWSFWREDGTLDDVRTYREGKSVSSRSYEFYQEEIEGRSLLRICRFDGSGPFTGRLDKTGVVGDKAFPFLYSGDVVDGFFEGNVREYYPAPGGQLAAEIEAWQGELDGTFTSWYSDGTLKGIAHYVRGKRDGLVTNYYPDGQLKITASYKQDKLHGKYTAYYRDSTGRMPYGRMKYDSQYADGKPVGTSRWWHEEGWLEAERENLEGDRNVMRWYYDNGQLKSCAEYVGNKRNGIKKTYDRDGTLSSMYTWRDDKKNGPCYDYDKQGKLEKMYTYLDDDVRHGPYERHNTLNGDVEGSYELDREVYRKERRPDGELHIFAWPDDTHSSIEVYNPDGVLRRRSRTEGGVKTDEKFRPDGSLGSRHTDTDEKNVTEYFRPDGTLQERVTRQYGDSIYKTYYDANGKMTSEKTEKWP